MHTCTECRVSSSNRQDDLPLLLIFLNAVAIPQAILSSHWEVQMSSIIYLNSYLGITEKPVTLEKVRGFQHLIPAASSQKPPGAAHGHKTPLFPCADLKGQLMHEVFITFAAAVFTVPLFTYLEIQHLCMFCKLSWHETLVIDCVLLANIFLTYFSFWL